MKLIVTIRDALSIDVYQVVLSEIRERDEVKLLSTHLPQLDLELVADRKFRDNMRHIESRKLTCLHRDTIYEGSLTYVASAKHAKLTKTWRQLRITRF